MDQKVDLSTKPFTSEWQEKGKPIVYIYQQRQKVPKVFSCIVFQHLGCQNGIFQQRQEEEKRVFLPRHVSFSRRARFDSSSDWLDDRALLCLFSSQKQRSSVVHPGSKTPALSRFETLHPVSPAKETDLSQLECSPRISKPSSLFSYL